MRKRVLSLFNWIVIVTTLTMAVGLAPASAAPPAAPPQAPVARPLAAPGVLLTEGFESTTFPPTNWGTTIVTGTTQGWSRVTSGSYPTASPHSGGAMAEFNSYSISSGNSTQLYTPILDMTGQTAPQLYFWMYHDTGYSTPPYDRIQVQVSTDGGTTYADLGAPVNRYDGSTSWKKHTFDVSAYIGQTNVRFGFLAISQYGNNMFIDDVFVGPLLPDLSTSTKSASAGVVTAANLLTYTVALVNSGTADATGATLVDPVPTGTSFVSIVTPPAATYNAGQNRIEWTGTVSQAAPVNVTFVVSVTGAGLPCPATITNTATISQSALTAPVSVSATTAYWTKLRYAEDFEASNGGYVASGTNSTWAWGTPTSGPGAAHSGTKLWATNLAGSYNASENSYLESPVVDLHAYVAVPGYPLFLSWWQWQYTESGYDYFSVDVRVLSETQRPERT